MEMRIARLAFGLCVVFAFAFFGLTLEAQAALSFPSVANLNPGDLIKSSNSSTVYYFGTDEQRYGFPNEKTYFTWYDDFDDVQTIAVSEMNLIPLAGMVTYNAQFGSTISTSLLKSQWSSTVYVPIGNGMLAALKSESTAKSLFGSDWKSYVDDLPDAFVPLYTILGGNLTSSNTFEKEYHYTISDDKEIGDVTGVMMYVSPLRFAASDESVDCGKNYCAYNVVTVNQGDTIKFVNYAENGLTVREANNRWTTGEMDAEDIVVLTIADRPGTYYFYADEDDDMIGKLIVK